ncbi:hypothetical protein [Dechloromonas sp. ZS-1]|uniref:hypothetical protein n=1 Tax=Dechloromonas sp. ZS-1 TaxID=3138067 RepID=UPI0031FE0138
MSIFYRITPINKKSIDFSCDVIAEDGRTCTITQRYSYGQGFLPLNDKDKRNERGSIECDLDLGWGAELDELESTQFEFDDAFTDIDKQVFKNLWNEHDVGLDDQPEHGWRIDNYRLVIYEPVLWELANDEQVTPKADANPSH